MAGTERGIAVEFGANGHEFGRDYIHVDTHVSYAIEDPGQNENQDVACFGK